MKHVPGSQSRAVLKEKEALAIQMLAQGLSVRQISIQLKCSETFVRRIRNEQRAAQEADAPRPAPPWNGVERRSGVDRRLVADRRSEPRGSLDRRSREDRRGHPFYRPRPSR
jgi:hypothetical protein